MTAKTVDKRSGPALFYHLMGGEAFGPDGETNTFYDVVGSVKRNGHAKVEKVGELQLGSDGFLETMFFLEGKLVKLKMLPTDGKVFIEGVWG